jgi:hypothetical protein
MLGPILLVFALVFAIFAAANWPPSPRVHWGWLAFAFFIASLLLGHVIL